MYEFKHPDVSRDAHYYDRIDPFADWLSDGGNDPADALAALVIRIGENLEHIFGPKAVEPAMQALVTTGGQQSTTWRETAADLANYIEWDLSQRLRELVGYAVFGLGGDRDAEGGPGVGKPASDRLNTEAYLEKALHTAEALMAAFPVEQWLPETEASLLRSTVEMARGRWNLDHRQNVSPDALALLGGVKMTRIRNMLSGTTPVLPRDEQGLVLYEPAMAWLSKRETFLPTARRDDDEVDEGTPEQAGLILSPVFVPVARDGSVFHPGLQRGGGYQIGPKDHEQKIESFEEALDRLQRMDVARWRRPNPNGNWGIVVASEWRRMERSELDALAEASAD